MAGGRSHPQSHPRAGLGPGSLTLGTFSPAWFGSSLPQHLPKAGVHLNTYKYLCPPPVPRPILPHCGFGMTPAHLQVQSLPTLPPAPNKRFTLPNVLVGLSIVKSVSEKLILLMLLISLSSACHLEQLWPGAAKLAQGPPCSGGVLGPLQRLLGAHRGCPHADVPLPGCQGHWWLRSQDFFLLIPSSLLSVAFLKAAFEDPL